MLNRTKGILICCLLPLVLGAALLQALAWMGIYQKPHAYHEASAWIHQNVPQGSRILGVHWDDKLPLSLPGKSAFRFKFEGPDSELALYEPDYLDRDRGLLNGAKLAKINRQLAGSDYLVLPTQRLPGSLLRVPEEYPVKTAMLRLLYAEKLGYQLIRTFKTRPAFFGLLPNDDLADESLSVYDHPKVAVFQNVGRLQPGEIEGRINSASSYEPLPDLSAVMQMDRTGARAPASSPHWGSVASVLIWFLALEILGLAVLPLVASILPAAPDSGYGVSKTFALLVCTLLCWLLSICGIYPFTGLTFALVVLLLALCSYAFAWAEEGKLSGLFSRLRLDVLICEGLFAGTFLFFVVLRLLYPEIFWGEKPMDFTFLNYFIRLESLPPGDPWVAGRGMNYYYLGDCVYALLHKVTGIDSAIGYNLSLATIGALLVSSLYTICFWLGRSRIYALIFSLLILLCSNFEVLRLALFSERRLNFDLFWASTRLFTSPAFAEYPLWALLFGDLHAHVMALPFGVLLLVMLCALFQSPERQSFRAVLLQCFLLGFIWGGFFLLNSWDLISYGLLSLLVVLVAYTSRLLERSQALWLRLLRMSAEGLAALAGMVCTLGVAVVTASGGISMHYGWVQEEEFNTLWQLFRHFGLWWLLAGLAFASICAGCIRLAPRAAAVRLLLSLLPAGLPFILAVLSDRSGVAGIPWSILSLSSCLCFAGSFLALERGRLEFDWQPVQRIIGLMLLAAGLVLAMTELCFLFDRMNTIFKSYNALWYWLAIAALALVPRGFGVLWGSGAGQGKLRCVCRVTFWGLTVVASLAVVAALAGSAVNLFIMTRDQKVAGPRPTLNGMAYLEKTDPDEARVIAWIRENVKGTPVLLEAFGPSYQAYTRISMNTGLPTVLGWEHHVNQRGTPRNEIERRRYDIRRIYASRDAGLVEPILERYKVQLVMTGDLERQTYGPGVDKFSAHPERFPVLYRSGNVVLYGVSRK